MNVPEILLQANANTTNFSQVPMEKSGQLYAYRINSSVVYLGTRDSAEFGASIGIKAIANGTYTCIVRNINENASQSITVAVLSKYAITSLTLHTQKTREIFKCDLQLTGPTLNIKHYIRFSTKSFKTIRRDLKLISDALVNGIIESAVLKPLLEGTTEQTLVECVSASS